MNPVKIVGGLMAAALILALVQGHYAESPGRKLALTSIRGELETLPKSEAIARAIALRGKIGALDEPEAIFRAVTVVDRAYILSDDLARPTLEEYNRIPIAEALEAVRRLGPATAFEGGRIRALYEARATKNREQMGILARSLAQSPTDDEVIRAYCAGLRSGGVEERRKAVELARDYAERAGGTALSRLTLLLCLKEDLDHRRDAKGMRDAKYLAASLAKDCPKDSLVAGQVENLARDFATR